MYVPAIIKGLEIRAHTGKKGGALPLVNAHPWQWFLENTAYTCTKHGAAPGTADDNHVLLGIFPFCGGEVKHKLRTAREALRAVHSRLRLRWQRIDSPPAACLTSDLAGLISSGAAMTLPEEYALSRPLASLPRASRTEEEGVW
jgi:hypothetical protein